MDKPLADLLRPTSLKDMVGQHHLFDEKAIFRKAFENDKITNMVFYGPPGVGKTTTADIVAKKSGKTLYKLNGTTCCIEDIKKIILESSSILNTNGILLYLDEIQYLNKKRQQSLLEFVEKGEITLIASTTENPYFYIYPALLSRCNVFEFKSISPEDIKARLTYICQYLGIKCEDEALAYLSLSCNGDIRKAINNLEFLYNALNKENKISYEDTISLLSKANIVYDSKQDKHYDNLSAFMKSLRGSDPNASVFYLAKLLETGDIIAASRRLLCSVNEDVGLAYPSLIPIVKACVDTALQLGLPEARLPLSNAAILIANAPKSNSSYLAIAKAQEDIKLGLGVEVPRNLQNTHFDGKDNSRPGQFYLYPHDFENHYVKQQYLPNDIKDHIYYYPQGNKIEQANKQYWENIKWKKEK